MKKYIVLSVNENVDYQYFVPLVCWAWAKFGWTPIVMWQGQVTFPEPEQQEDGSFKLNQVTSMEHLIFDLISSQPWNGLIAGVDKIEGYRSDTITQISRLYTACLNLDWDDYLMTGDIDMLPLSDYWKPELSSVSVYGHDLTGFGHYPICYIGMPVTTWRIVMNIITPNDYNTHIHADLDKLPQAKDPDFYKYWFSDQDLITERLKQYGTGKIDFINRGQGSHGYARGRVDRANGGWVLDQPELIDAHLMQQTHHSEEKIRKLFDLLEHVWPDEDFQWFRDYTVKFRELAK